MKSIKDTTLKVGDRVKWFGVYPKLINGYTMKTAKEYLSANRDNKDNINWIEKNTKPVKRKGVNTIKSISYHDLFEEIVITLHNGKIFENDKNLTLIEK
jgi:hypothetical protein